MKHISLRLKDSVHAALSEELKEWQKLRGPRFSLNNLCEEKLSTPFPPTPQWFIPMTSTGTFSTPTNYVYTVTYNPPTFVKQEEKQNARKRK